MSDIPAPPRLESSLDPHEVYAWLRYFLDTETFDRRLVGEWSEYEPECWIPFDRGQSWRFASQKRGELRDRGFRLQFGSDEHRYAMTLSFSRQLEELRALVGSGKTVALEKAGSQ